MPQLRNVDEAIRRRLHLVPFTVTIPEGERDETLPERLREELPGILEWAIEGAVGWYEGGLQPPHAVRKATDDYLAAEDAIALWIEECCESQERTHETTADLYASWKAWAEKAGEFAGSQKAFSENMRTRGFEPKRQAGTGKAGFKDIALIRPDYTDAHWNQ